MNMDELHILYKRCLFQESAKKITFLSHRNGWSKKRNPSKRTYWDSTNQTKTYEKTTTLTFISALTYLSPQIKSLFLTHLEWD